MYARWFRDGRSFDLGRMTFPDLWRAYLSHPAVHLYVAVTLVSIVVAVLHPPGLWACLAAIAATAVAYPVAWYGIHRFILHGRLLYRSPLTAQLWKRIHFDHHQDPNRMDVLFGAPITTLPTILLILIPLGWAIGGLGGAGSAVAMGLVITCFYEFIHCIQHLNIRPRTRLLRRMKELHLLHHFHDEVGNYGITSFVADRLLGTYYGSAKDRRRSATVFNLGYTPAESLRFPWVARLSGGPPRDRPPAPTRPAHGRII
jgi:sterol desaturase/sphingolipid hydroxylase (fatty acid hydroxylase superfamily)